MPWSATGVVKNVDMKKDSITLSDGKVYILTEGFEAETFKAGEKVVMFYNAANRDEAVFADPYRFNVTRDPNDHVGFGGGGTHFCLGANLARREIRVMFEELLTRLPDIHVVGTPDLLQSGFIHGIKRMRVEFTPQG